MRDRRRDETVDDNFVIFLVYTRLYGKREIDVHICTTNMFPIIAMHTHLSIIFFFFFRRKCIYFYTDTTGKSINNGSGDD